MIKFKFIWTEIFCGFDWTMKFKSDNENKINKLNFFFSQTGRNLSRKEKVATPKRRALGNRRTPGIFNVKKKKFFYRFKINPYWIAGRKTPGSLKKSANKLVPVASKFGIATRETSRRALFMSPTKDEVKQPTLSSSASDISRRIEKSKRALFSPPRRLERSISNISNDSNTSCSNSCSSMFGSSNKRNHYDRISCFNRTSSDVSINFKRRLVPDDDENMEPHRRKSQRTEVHSSALLQKAASENSMYQSQQLSASHKQKLLWAVSTALKKKTITSTHTNFNAYGSILGKVVKRLYLESLPTKTESTSGTMLRYKIE